MLQEPQPSPYDVQFRVFGFPVRIAWGFWILAAVLGWEHTQQVDRVFLKLDLGTPGAFPLLVIFTAGLFLSILVHELGHSLAFKFYGNDSHIVLYHFGGLAIPGSFTAWNAARKRFTNVPQHLIVISAAGPAAQLLLAIVVWAIATSLRIETGLNEWITWASGIDLGEMKLGESASVYVLVDVLVTQSVFWALLNLLPILPLDGGNIMREILRLNRVADPWRSAAMISLVVVGLLAVWLFQGGRQGAGLMCLGLAATNIQILQRPGGF